MVVSIKNKVNMNPNFGEAEKNSARGEMLYTE
jgi:hypothetical protein